jgi:hypothetical protein
MRTWSVDVPERYFEPDTPRGVALFERAKVTSGSSWIKLPTGLVLVFGDSQDLATFLDLLTTMYNAKRDLEQKSIVREVVSGGSATDAVGPAAEGPA